MAQKNGLKSLLVVGGNIYGGQITGGGSASRDEIDVTTKMSVEQWKEFLMGEKELTFNVEGIQAHDASNSAFTQIFEDFNENTPLTIAFGEDAPGAKMLQADGYVQSVDFTSAKNEGETYSSTIRVTGKPEVIDVS